MIELTKEQVSALKQGHPVRVAAPQFGGELVILLAVQRESTESVLQDTLNDLREKQAAFESGRRSASAWAQETSF